MCVQYIYVLYTIIYILYLLHQGSLHYRPCLLGTAVAYGKRGLGRRVEFVSFMQTWQGVKEKSHMKIVDPKFSSTCMGVKTRSSSFHCRCLTESLQTLFCSKCCAGDRKLPLDSCRVFTLQLFGFYVEGLVLSLLATCEQ